MTIELGDWVVFTIPVRKTMLGPLGGPWRCGRIAKIKINHYSVDTVFDGETVDYPAQGVMRDRIVKMCISQGEARIAVRELHRLEAEYVERRDTLKPEYQDRISAVLAD